MRARERKLAPIARHKTIRGEGSNWGSLFFCLSPWNFSRSKQSLTRRRKDATTTGAGDSTTAPARRRKAATTGSAGADCTRCTPRWKGSARAYAPCVCEMEVHGSYIRTHETGRTSGNFRGRASLASECDDEGTRGRGRHLQRPVMERGGTRLSSLRCKEEVRCGCAERASLDPHTRPWRNKLRWPAAHTTTLDCKAGWWSAMPAPHRLASA